MLRLKINILRKAYFSFLHVVSSASGGPCTDGLGCFVQEAVIGRKIYDSRNVRVP